jgi:hypothetical protein
MSLDELPQGPVCVNLRTKKMYYRDGLRETDPSTDPHPYCWCMVTMGQFGPDDGLVAVQNCRPGRDCFEEREA